MNCVCGGGCQLLFFANSNPSKTLGKAYGLIGGNRVRQRERSAGFRGLWDCQSVPYGFCASAVCVSALTTGQTCSIWIKTKDTVLENQLYPFVRNYWLSLWGAVSTWWTNGLTVCTWASSHIKTYYTTARNWIRFTWFWVCGHQPAQVWNWIIDLTYKCVTITSLTDSLSFLNCNAFQSIWLGGELHHFYCCGLHRHWIVVF